VHSFQIILYTTKENYFKGFCLADVD